MIKHILTTALTGLAIAPALATDAQTYGDILDGINMYTPEEGDPDYKIKANEQFGTQWLLDMAYGYWHTNGASLNNHNHSPYCMLL